MRTPLVFFFIVSTTWIAASSCTTAPRRHGDAGTPDSGIDESMPGWKLAWVVRAGGDEHHEPDAAQMFREAGTALAVLDDGSSYLAGMAAESAVFGEGEPNETVFPDGSCGWSDAFLARYNPDGTLSWVRRIGGADSGTGDYGFDVATLADGSAVIVGRFDAPEIVLGEGEPNETVLVANAEWDDFNAFVARYAPDGDLVWAIRIPKEDETHLYGWTVHTLPDGRLLVGGLFHGTLWPGGKCAISSMPSDDASNNWDGFLAWLDTDGRARHAVRIGGDRQYLFHAVEVTEEGGAIVAAPYDGHGNETFGLGDPNETVLHCDNGFSCTALARYDGHGHLKWARDLGIFNTSATVSIAQTGSGDVGLVARFASPSDPDGDGAFFELDGDDEHGDSEYGALVAKYRAEDGALVWARMGRNRGHKSYGLSRSIFAMPDGETIAGFSFYRTLVFEGYDVGQRSLVSTGDQDIALLSLSADGEIRWMHRMGGEEGKDLSMAGAQLSGSSLWFTGAYGSNPFIATSGNDDAVALPLDGYTDVFLMRFDATTPPSE